MGAERAGEAVLLLRSDQLCARREPDVERRIVHGGASLGWSTNENSYQIDGTEISSTPWPNTDAVEEVEVLQLGASAEYGNVQGAVFNIVTRQGGNQLHGDAQRLLPERRADRPQHHGVVRQRLPVSSRDVAGRHGAGVGPIHQGQVLVLRVAPIPERLGLTARRRPAFPAKSDARRMFWKFNYNINDNHRLLNGYHDDFYWIPRNDLGLQRAEHHQPEPRTQPDAQHRLHGRVDVQDARRGALLGLLAAGSTDPNETGQPRVASASRRRHSSGDRWHREWTENSSWRNGPQGKLSHYADSFLGGSHDLKSVSSTATTAAPPSTARTIRSGHTG